MKRHPHQDFWWYVFEGWARFDQWLQRKGWI